MNTNKSIKAIKLMSFILMLLIIISCSNNYKETMQVKDVPVSEEYNAVEKIGKPKTSVKPLNLKIIKTATVKYKVSNIKEITSKISKIVGLKNGYISDLRYQNDLYQKENRFTIKIPQTNFDYVLDSISKFAEFVEFENITSKDVTEEYIDLQTRLNTKIEVKKRYENILRKRAKTVEDILATEEKLRIIQEEIEATQGRLNYLTNKVSLSTIQVTLYETVIYKKEPKNYTKTFLTKLKNGFSYGWKIIENMLIGLVHVWPLLLIGFGVLFFLKRRK